MQPWHLTIAARGRSTLFSESDALAAAAGTLARVVGERLLLFSIADDHAHVVVLGDAAQASNAAGSITRALGAAGAPERSPADIRPVEGRVHLERLVRYHARQVEKHGIQAHPALWPGSCAPDLLGVRRLPGYDPERIGRALPRFPVRSAVLDAAGVWSGALIAGELPAGLGASLRVALEAVGESEPSKLPHAVAALIAWSHLRPEPAAELAEAAGVGVSTVRAWRRRPAEVGLVDVIRRRASLVAWVASLEYRQIARAEQSAPPDVP